MQRKWFVLLAGLVLFSLLIAPVGMVGAQGTPPPTPKAFQPFQPPSNPPFEMDGVGGSRSSLFPTVSGVNAPAASVGASGFSFSYSKTIGTTGEPYLVDVSNDAYLNGPRGIFVDAGGNLYVAENKGSRVQKFDSTGSLVLSLGHAGQAWHHDDFLSQPQDVAVRAGDGHIWALSSPMLKEFDASGTLLQTFPETNPWESGSDNGHFNDPKGVAFGAGGYLYVADSWNHRIQIFDTSVTPLVYVATVGVTESPRSDNSGFNYPIQIAFDSLDRMYVVDNNNLRVQRCESSDPWDTWTCDTFYGETGVDGDDLTHMSWSDGIGIDSSDNIFIADGNNRRVLKCDTASNCELFAGETGVPGSDNAHFSYADDVAIDSSGNVYVSDPDNYRVQKFNSAGVYQSTIGVSGVPYLTDDAHFNKPWGIALAADGGFYVAEQSGYRLIKMDADGVQQWAVGEAGIFGDDNTHFGNWSGGLEGGPAVDANGRVYIGDTANNRVQIFNSNGTYYDTLGIGGGQGNYEFACPSEVAIHPTNGDIYVLDRCNQRVQVFTSAMGYKGTIGTTDSSGDDNLHFNWPNGLTVDASSNVFVADHDNHRVQKCTLLAAAPGFSCSTFLGETGVSGEDFNHFGGPISVEVDNTGRVYVIEEWNGRVQIFDASGAYLTTVGGIGDGLSNPSGLAIDAKGNLYITDRDNHRIEVFTPGTPGWRQANINGFGERANQGIFSMTTFDNQLYAGTINDVTGGQIWRSSNGKTWSSVVTNGLGDVTNMGIDDLLTFNNQLYAGVYSWDLNTNQTHGGQLWRSSDGDTWTQLALTGFDPLTNIEFFRLASYDGQLYASTWADGSHGGEIWRSATGNSNDWSQVESNGFGDVNNEVVLALASHNTYFYAGTWNSTTGAEVWRSLSGAAGSWVQVNTDGFSDADRVGISALTSYDGYLYAGVRRRMDTGGAEVWRCQVCDGSDWIKVVDDGFGDGDSQSMSALEVSNGRLYLVIGNWEKGLSVWRTNDGLAWEQVGFHGFGTSNNYAAYWDNAVSTFGGNLYVGTLNWSNGGQIWQILNQLYLPLVLR